MLSADKSVLGLSRQTGGKGVPVTTDNLFKYILFTEGTPSPQNITRPLDREVGGGALPQGAVKVGVLSGAQAQFIPRPQTLGELLMAQLGSVTSVGTDVNADLTDDYYTHTFTLPADQFSQPYYTLRSGPSMAWGEQFPDSVLGQLALRWRGADFLRGAFGFQGGEPLKVATTTWAPDTYVDEGPQFLSPLSAIELPTASPIKVLEGALTFGSAIPLDEQWIIGSYSPDDFPVVNRAIGITMTVKIADDSLYTKMQYDPAGGNAWTADIFREANIRLNFKSDVEAAASVPYELDIAANGQSGANANVQWSAQPIGIQAGRQIKMVVSGVFTASPTVDEPITVTLKNQQASY